MTNIKIIAGSTRPGRFNKQVADWVYAQSQNFNNEASFELVDLEAVNLPMYNEPKPAMAGDYEHEHTQKWAEIIGEADGFIVIAPEYNHSIPAALKNAFDYLNAEWNHKPVSYVSYGSAAGGARSVEHLRAVAGELRMFALRDQILLPNYWEHMSDNGEYQFTDKHVDAIADQIQQIIFWAGIMKDARAKLADN